MLIIDVFPLFIDLKCIKSHLYLQSKWYYSCRLKNEIRVYNLVYEIDFQEKQVLTL